MNGILGFVLDTSSSSTITACATARIAARTIVTKGRASSFTITPSSSSSTTRSVGSRRLIPVRASGNSVAVV